MAQRKLPLPMTPSTPWHAEKVQPAWATGRDAHHHDLAAGATAVWVDAERVVVVAGGAIRGTRGLMEASVFGSQVPGTWHWSSAVQHCVRRRCRLPSDAGPHGWPDPVSWAASLVQVPAAGVSPKRSAQE